MTKNIIINIISIKKYISIKKIKFIYIKSYLNKIQIYPFHTPLVTLLEKCLLKIVFLNSKKKYLKIKNGFLIVKKNKIDILVDNF